MSFFEAEGPEAADNSEHFQVFRVKQVVENIFYWSESGNAPQAEVQEARKRDGSPK